MAAKAGQHDSRDDDEDGLGGRDRERCRTFERRHMSRSIGGCSIARCTFDIVQAFHATVEEARLHRRAVSLCDRRRNRALAVQARADEIRVRALDRSEPFGAGAFDRAVNAFVDVTPPSGCCRRAAPSRTAPRRS